MRAAICGRQEVPILQPLTLISPMRAMFATRMDGLGSLWCRVVVPEAMRRLAVGLLALKRAKLDHGRIVHHDCIC
jgi:hypothetical protein